MTPVCARYLFIFLLIGGLLTFAKPSHSQPALSIPEGKWTIPFYWLSDSTNGRLEPHAAMLVPVYFKGNPVPCYLQFDLGSPYTLFYTGKLRAIGKAMGMAATATDSLVKQTLNGFHLGGMLVTGSPIQWREYGNEQAVCYMEGKAIELIGTVGTDLIAGRTLWINYPEQQLEISPSLDANTPLDMPVADMYFTGGKILLPATILAKPTLLMFDTGTSAFSLLTDKANYYTLAQPGLASSHQVNSWGNTLTAHTAPTEHRMEMAGQQIPIRQVTYMEGASAAMVNQMQKTGMGGMLGNTPFLSYKLMIDTKNKRFGLKK